MTRATLRVRRRASTQGAIFLALCLTITVAAAGALHLAFRLPDERRALWIGAAIAVVVQAAAFAVARRLARTNVFAGWGLGTVLRFVAIALTALVVVPLLDLPLAAALLSLAIYLFLSTLVEPLFLKP